MFDAHKNFAIGNVLTGPSPALSGQTFILQPGEGQFFGPNMPVTLTPSLEQVPNFDNSEIGYVTAVVGDTLTILRAREDSTPKAVEAGWVVFGSITAKTIQDLEDAIQGAIDKHFEQSFTAQAEVTVLHQLGKRPAVSVEDSAGDEVEGSVEYVDTDTLIVRFSAPFSGRVLCN